MNVEAVSEVLHSLLQTSGAEHLLVVSREISCILLSYSQASDVGFRGYGIGYLSSTRESISSSTNAVSGAASIRYRPIRTSSNSRFGLKQSNKGRLCRRLFSSRSNNRCVILTKGPFAERAAPPLFAFSQHNLRQR
jgi:hypothetical protein